MAKAEAAMLAVHPDALRCPYSSGLGFDFELAGMEVEIFVPCARFEMHANGTTGDEVLLRRALRFCALPLRQLRESSDLAPFLN